MALIDDFWPEENDWRAAYRPYVVKDGVLQIPVRGVLLNNFPWQLYDWATGYDYIARAFSRGLNDPKVNGIAFVIDSPGGEVAGNFDLVDMIYAGRGQKPMRAFAAESAYSAAYSIASAADTIVVSRTGGVGSIGVVTAHIDVSKALDRVGIAVTFIHFGKHKVDGNPYEPLPDDVKARIQARIDELGAMFVSIVARNRGMEEQVIRDTEALTYTASQATSIGLADEIGPLEDGLAAFAAELSTNRKGNAMGQNTSEQTAVDQASIDKAREEGKTEGLKAGATAERSRIAAIVNSDNGKSRPKMALKMALGDKFATLDSDTVVEMLGDMPEEKAESAENTTGKTFRDAMDSGKNPDIGAPSDDEESRVDATLTRIKGPRKAA
ncbi:S49 family peptidase [Hartmannibacter diazotrophicus]|nr:S49 family peptidase [Hartmannibacter diazotrophicus]